MATLATLKFCNLADSMMHLYDWVLDLSRMTTLTSLILEQPHVHRREQQVQDLRARAGRTDLDISITRVPRHGVYSVTKRDITRLARRAGLCTGPTYMSSDALELASSALKDFVSNIIWDAVGNTEYRRR